MTETVPVEAAQRRAIVEALVARFRPVPTPFDPADPGEFSCLAAFVAADGFRATRTLTYGEIADALVEAGITVEEGFASKLVARLMLEPGLPLLPFPELPQDLAMLARVIDTQRAELHRMRSAIAEVVRQLRDARPGGAEELVGRLQEAVE